MILVGLGNPGKKFSGTWHNLGIDSLRFWVEQVHPQSFAAVWRKEEDFLAEIISFSIINDGGIAIEVVCLFPLRGMNNSGQVVAQYMNKHSLPLDSMIIVHDDIELPLGQIVVQDGGSAKGHNGVRSIQQALGSHDFKRLRLGIGRPPVGVPVEQFVLSSFTAEEKPMIEQLKHQAALTLGQMMAEEKQ